MANVGSTKAEPKAGKIRPERIRNNVILSFDILIYYIKNNCQGKRVFHSYFAFVLPFL